VGGKVDIAMGGNDLLCRSQGWWGEIFFSWVKVN